MTTLLDTQKYNQAEHQNTFITVRGKIAKNNPISKTPNEIERERES